jgi:hypothetical protein
MTLSVQRKTSSLLLQQRVLRLCCQTSSLLLLQRPATGEPERWRRPKRNGDDRMGRACPSPQNIFHHHCPQLHYYHAT